MFEVPTLLAESTSNLLAARNQMAFTLGFHIVLASIGVAFPAVMLVAEYRGRKHNDAEVQRAARQLRARLVFENDCITNIAHQLGYFQTIGSWRTAETLRQRIEAVTLDRGRHSAADTGSKRPIVRFTGARRFAAAR